VEQAGGGQLFAHHPRLWGGVQQTGPAIQLGQVSRQLTEALFWSALCIRIRIGSDLHHFAGSGSVSVSIRYRTVHFLYGIQNILNYDTCATDKEKNIVNWYCYE